MAERFVIPGDLARAAASEGRGDWLAGLPALVARIAADWRIEVGDPFLPGGATAAAGLASRGARSRDRQPAAAPVDEAPSRPRLPASDMCDYWATRYEQRSAAERSGLAAPLAKEGIRLLRELPRSGGGALLLHTDLHAGNVLAAEREPWLVIDPKPYVGDPAYDVTQHIFNGVFIEGADAGALLARTLYPLGGRFFGE